MSGAGLHSVLHNAAGELRPRYAQVLELARLPLGEIAAQTGLNPATAKVYLSWLRRAGYSVPTQQYHCVGSSILLRLEVTAAVADELAAQASMRSARGKAVSVHDLAETLLAIIHKDNLYNAILGEPKRAARRAA